MSHDAWQWMIFMAPSHHDRFCMQCRFDLFGLTTPRCPECGRPFDPDDESTWLPSPDAAGKTDRPQFYFEKIVSFLLIWINHFLTFPILTTRMHRISAAQVIMFGLPAAVMLGVALVISARLVWRRESHWLWRIIGVFFCLYQLHFMMLWMSKFSSWAWRYVFH